MWFHPETPVSWRPIEDILVQLYRIQDLPFSGLKLFFFSIRMGTIIANILQTLHTLYSIWQNAFLLTGSHPSVYSHWSTRNIHTLNDIFGLCFFHDLQEQNSLPGFSFFLYLRLHSSLRACGVSWGSPVRPHPLVNLFYSSPPG